MPIYYLLFIVVAFITGMISKIHPLHKSVGKNMYSINDLLTNQYKFKSHLKQLAKLKKERKLEKIKEIKHKFAYNQIIWSKDNYKWSIQPNLCTNGKYFSIKDNKAYLREFAKGPCSPLMILPGLVTSKMVIEVDCEELQSKSTDIFNKCGFTHCEKEIWEVK